MLVVESPEARTGWGCQNFRGSSGKTWPWPQHSRIAPCLWFWPLIPLTPSAQCVLSHIKVWAWSSQFHCPISCLESHLTYRGLLGSWAPNSLASPSTNWCQSTYSEEQTSYWVHPGSQLTGKLTSRRIGLLIFQTLSSFSNGAQFSSVWSSICKGRSIILLHQMISICRFDENKQALNL